MGSPAVGVSLGLLYVEAEHQASCIFYVHMSTMNKPIFLFTGEKALISFTWVIILPPSQRGKKKLLRLPGPESQVIEEENFPVS